MNAKEWVILLISLGIGFTIGILWMYFFAYLPQNNALGICIKSGLELLKWCK